jgi:GGDEF domain-containing protein
VIPSATNEEVKRIGMGVVEAVYSAKMRSAPDSPFPYLSISAGASLCSMVPETNLDDYLPEADKELYLAKKVDVTVSISSARKSNKRRFAFYSQGITGVLLTSFRGQFRTSVCLL